MPDIKRIVVWGTGYYGHRFDKLMKEYYGDFGYGIIGYTNSYDVDDKSLAPFIKHENLENSTDYDLIVVAANQKNEREIISFLIEKRSIASELLVGKK